jgi:hypothetical protein
VHQMPQRYSNRLGELVRSLEQSGCIQFGRRCRSKPLELASSPLSPPGGGFLIGLTNSGLVKITSGAVLNLQGAINNTCTFQLNGSILTNGTVTLQGAGSVIMNGGTLGSSGPSPRINKQLVQARDFSASPLDEPRHNSGRQHLDTTVHHRQHHKQ